MKKLLFVFFIFLTIQSFGQNPPNYQYRTVRERLVAMMVDSSFHIPRYNGVPSGLRVGSSPHDGLLGADTLNHNLYFFSNGWKRMAKYSDLTGGVSYVDTIYNRNDSVFYLLNSNEYFVAIAGEGAITAPYTALKYWTGYKTFGSLPDSVRAQLSAGVNITYNSSTGVIGADTTAGFTKLATQGDIIRDLDNYAVLNQDSAAMLGNYIHSAGWGLLKTGQQLRLDTSITDLRYGANTVACGLTCSNCGLVTWSGTGLIFNVSESWHNHDFVPYHTGAGSITLDAADGTFGRFDAIGLTINGIEKITGDASADPQFPQFDPCEFVLLTYVFVGAGATTPTLVTDELVYDEDAGGEWTHTTTGTLTTNFASTAQFFHGSKSALISVWTNNANIIFTEGGPVPVNSFNTLTYWLRLTVAFTNSQNISVQFFNGITAVSNQVVANISKSTLNTWQGITMSPSQFVFTSASFTAIRFILSGSAGASPFYMDWIRLQSGVSQPTSSSGLTNAYTRITDGTNTAISIGSDIFKLRSNLPLRSVVTNNDATHGDNVLNSVDTSVAFVPSLTTNGRLLKVADSIRVAAIAGAGGNIIDDLEATLNAGSTITNQSINATNLNIVASGGLKAYSGTGNAQSGIVGSANNSVLFGSYADIVSSHQLSEINMDNNSGAGNTHLNLTAKRVSNTYEKISLSDTAIYIEGLTGGVAGSHLYIPDLANVVGDGVLMYNAVDGRVSWSTASSGGGGSAKFGKSGEDDVAAESRTFDLEGFDFTFRVDEDLSNGNSYLVLKNFDPTYGNTLSAQMINNDSVSTLNINRFGTTIESSRTGSSSRIDVTPTWVDISHGSEEFYVSGGEIGMFATTLYIDLSGSECAGCVLTDVDGDGYATWQAPTGGGGYTNLTQFVAQNNWKVFYSDGSGDIQELSLGANNTYLKSNGATSAPSFAAITAGTGSNLSWDAANHQVDIDGGGTSATIPYAATNAEGLVSTATQFFTGSKTFNTINWNSGTASTLGTLGATTVGSDDYGVIQLGSEANANQGIIYTEVLTATRSYTLPDEDGRLVLSVNGNTADAAGNVTIAAGGSGTVNTGASGKAAYYSGAGTTVDDFVAVDYALSGTNVTITQQNTTDVPVLIQLAASAAEDAFQVKNSGGTTLVSINENGLLAAGGATPTYIGSTSGVAALWLYPDNPSNAGEATLSRDNINNLTTLNAYTTNLGLRVANNTTFMVNMTANGKTGIGVPYNYAATAMLDVQAVSNTTETLRLLGAEAGDATILLAADESDDNIDDWWIKSLTTNDLTISNHTTTVLTLNTTNITAAFDVIVPDEAYDATAWNGSLEVPTKNAIRDKIESLSAGGGHIIEEEGTPLAAQPDLNFIGGGITAADDAGNTATTITLDGDLNTIAGLTATTDNFIVSVSSAWASRTPSQVRTTLGLVIGTDVQAFDGDLTTWAGITPGSNVGTFLATPSSANLRSAITDENGTGALLFSGNTSAVFNTAVLDGAVTGTGVATGATASTLTKRDADANITANNWLGGYTTTATAAGTTTLTVGSTYLQYFTGSTTQTVTLPVASTLTLGHQFVIVNNSTGNVTVNSSGGNAVVVLAGGTSTVVTCILTSGTSAASWAQSYSAANLVSGKKLTVNNSIILAGTDGTTMTLPSTSATIARTDAAQTFTGSQTFSSEIITNNPITASGNAATVPVTASLSTVTNNSAATLTITMATASAVDGQLTTVRILDFSAAAQTITWVNTENSSIAIPTTSNGSTTLPLTVTLMFNNATTKWRVKSYN